MGAPQFLRDDTGREDVHPGTAVLDGDFRADEVVLCGFFHKVMRVRFLFVVFARNRLDFLLSELADGLSDGTMFLRKLKTHTEISFVGR